MATDEDTARGLVRIEGYLLWSAELEEARRQAARFAGQLPWLTIAQRDDVERVYTADRVAVSRAVLVRISDRAAELRGEYTARYEQLKRRCVSVTVMAVGAVSGTYTAITLLSR